MREHPHADVPGRDGVRLDPHPAIGQPGGERQPYAALVRRPLQPVLRVLAGPRGPPHPQSAVLVDLGRDVPDLGTGLGRAAHPALVVRDADAEGGPGVDVRQEGLEHVRRRVLLAAAAAAAAAEPGQPDQRGARERGTVCPD